MFGVSAVHEAKMQFYHISRVALKSQPLRSLKALMSLQNIK